MKEQKTNPYNNPKIADEEKGKLDQLIAKLFVVTKKGDDPAQAIGGVTKQMLSMLNK